MPKHVDKRRRAFLSELPDIKEALAKSSAAIKFLRSQPPVSTSTPLRLMRDVEWRDGDKTAQVLLKSKDVAAPTGAAKTALSDAELYLPTVKTTAPEPTLEHTRQRMREVDHSEHSVGPAVTLRTGRLGRLQSAVHAVHQVPEVVALNLANRNSAKVTQLLAKEATEPPIPMYKADGSVVKFTPKLPLAVQEAAANKRPVSAFRTARGQLSDDIKQPTIHMPNYYPDLSDARMRSVTDGEIARRVGRPPVQPKQMSITAAHLPAHEHAPSDRSLRTLAANAIAVATNGNGQDTRAPVVLDAAVTYSEQSVMVSNDTLAASDAREALSHLLETEQYKLTKKFMDEAAAPFEPAGPPALLGEAAATKFAAEIRTAQRSVENGGHSLGQVLRPALNFLKGQTASSHAASKTARPKTAPVIRNVPTTMTEKLAKDVWVLADRTDPHAAVHPHLYQSGTFKVGEAVFTPAQTATILAVHPVNPVLATTYAAVAHMTTRRAERVAKQKRAFSASSSNYKSRMQQEAHLHMYQQGLSRASKFAALDLATSRLVRDQPVRSAVSAISCMRHAPDEGAIAAKDAVWVDGVGFTDIPTVETVRECNNQSLPVKLKTTFATDEQSANKGILRLGTSSVAFGGASYDADDVAMAVTPKRRPMTAAARLHQSLMDTAIGRVDLSGMGLEPPRNLPKGQPQVEAAPALQNMLSISSKMRPPSYCLPTKMLPSGADEDSLRNHYGDVDDVQTAVRLYARRDQLAQVLASYHTYARVLERVPDNKIQGLTCIEQTFLKLLRFCLKSGLVLSGDNLFSFLEQLDADLHVLPLEELPTDMKREAELERAVAAAAAKHVVDLISSSSMRASMLSLRRDSEAGIDGQACLKANRKMRVAAAILKFAKEVKAARETHSQTLDLSRRPVATRPSSANNIKWRSRPGSARVLRTADHSDTGPAKPSHYARPASPRSRPGTAPATKQVDGATTANSQRQNKKPDFLSGLSAEAQLVCMTREERAARRSLAEWPIRLYHPINELLQCTVVTNEAYAEWLAPRGLVVPTPELVCEAEERERRSVAAATRASDAASSSVSAQAHRRAERSALLHSTGVRVWDTVRTAVHTGQMHLHQYGDDA